MYHLLRNGNIRNVGWKEWQRYNTAHKCADNILQYHNLSAPRYTSVSLTLALLDNITILDLNSFFTFKCFLLSCLSSEHSGYSNVFLVVLLFSSFVKVQYYFIYTWVSSKYYPHSLAVTVTLFVELLFWHNYF